MAVFVVSLEHRGEYLVEAETRAEATRRAKRRFLREAPRKARVVSWARLPESRIETPGRGAGGSP